MPLQSRATESVGPLGSPALVQAKALAVQFEDLLDHLSLHAVPAHPLADHFHRILCI
jgi:hypothetical protein